MSLASSNIKTNDKSVRERLLQSLYVDRGISGIVEEFTIARGKARADVVSIRDLRLHAFEIKSDVDTLTRLPNQVKYYSQVFSSVTLVVSAEHIAKAIYVIPDWWGVTVAIADEDGVVLNQIREAKTNPSIDYDLTSDLLKKNELISLLVSTNTNKRYGSMSKGRLINEVKLEFGHELLDRLSNSILSRQYTQQSSV